MWAQGVDQSAASCLRGAGQRGLPLTTRTVSRSRRGELQGPVQPLHQVQWLRHPPSIEAGYDALLFSVGRLPRECGASCARIRCTGFGICPLTTRGSCAETASGR